MWLCNQGLFERHKLVMASQLCMAVLQKAGKLQQVKYNYLVRGLRRDTIPNAVKEWLPDTTWFGASALAVGLDSICALRSKFGHIFNQ